MGDGGASRGAPIPNVTPLTDRGTLFKSTAEVSALLVSCVLSIVRRDYFKKLVIRHNLLVKKSGCYHLLSVYSVEIMF